MRDERFLKNVQFVLRNILGHSEFGLENISFDIKKLPSVWLPKDHILLACEPTFQH